VTSWDDGYVKAQTILPKTNTSYDTGEYVGNGSCVAFVKASLGVTESWFTPYYVWNHADLLSLTPLSKPKIGSIIILDEGPVWHMGLVQEITESGIIIIEQNYVPNTVGTRNLNIDDPDIVGFLYLD